MVTQVTSTEDAAAGALVGKGVTSSQTDRLERGPVTDPSGQSWRGSKNTGRQGSQSILRPTA